MFKNKSWMVLRFLALLLAVGLTAITLRSEGDAAAPPHVPGVVVLAPISSAVLDNTSTYMSVSPTGTVYRGQTLTYNLYVYNNGTAATGAKVRDVTRGGSSHLSRAAYL